MGLKKKPLDDLTPGELSKLKGMAKVGMNKAKLSPNAANILHSKQHLSFPEVFKGIDPDAKIKIVETPESLLHHHFFEPKGVEPLHYKDIDALLKADIESLPKGPDELNLAWSKPKNFGGYTGGFVTNSVIQGAAAEAVKAGALTKEEFTAEFFKKYEDSEPLTTITLDSLSMVDDPAIQNLPKEMFEGMNTSYNKSTLQLVKDHNVIITEEQIDSSVTIRVTLQENEYDAGSDINGLIYDIMQGIQVHIKKMHPGAKGSDHHVLVAVKSIRMHILQEPAHFTRIVRRLIDLQNMVPDNKAVREYQRGPLSYPHRYQVKLTVTGDKAKHLSWQYQLLDPF